MWISWGLCKIRFIFSNLEAYSIQICLFLTIITLFFTAFASVKNSTELVRQSNLLYQQSYSQKTAVLNMHTKLNFYESSKTNTLEKIKWCKSQKKDLSKNGYAFLSNGSRLSQEIAKWEKWETYETLSFEDLVRNSKENNIIFAELYLKQENCRNYYRWKKK